MVRSIGYLCRAIRNQVEDGVLDSFICMASVSATVEARTKLDGTQFGSAYLVVSVANKVGASRFRDCFWWRRNIGLVRALSWPLQGSTVPRA